MEEPRISNPNYVGSSPMGYINKKFEFFGIFC